MPRSPGAVPAALPLGLKASGTCISRTWLPSRRISRTVGFWKPAALRWPSLLQNRLPVAAL